MRHPQNGENWKWHQIGERNVSASLTCRPRRRTLLPRACRWPPRSRAASWRPRPARIGTGRPDPPACSQSASRTQSEIVGRGSDVAEKSTTTSRSKNNCPHPFPWAVSQRGCWGRAATGEEGPAAETGAKVGGRRLRGKRGEEERACMC